jgi:hypothetical protein
VSRRLTTNAIKTQPCVIYALANDVNGLVKIGRTSFTADKRQKTIQAMCPVRVILVWETKAIGGYEKALHHYFHGRRQHGEFFDFVDVEEIPAVMEEAMRYIAEHRQETEYKSYFGWWWE